MAQPSRAQTSRNEKVHLPRKSNNEPEEVAITASASSVTITRTSLGVLRLTLLVRIAIMHYTTCRQNLAHHGASYENMSSMTMVIEMPMKAPIMKKGLTTELPAAPLAIAEPSRD